MSYVAFAWIASAMYGVEAVAGKLTSKHSISNPWLFNFFWSLFILMFTVPIAIFYGARVPSMWANILWGSFFYASASLLYVLALYKLDVSVIAPLFSFRTALAVMFGALFLGEILTTQQYFLIGIIFIFGIVVSIDEKMNIKSFFNPGIAIAMTSMIALVLMAVFIKKAVAEVGFWDTTLWVALIGQFWLLPTLPLFKRDLPETTIKQYGVTVFTAIAGVVGTLTANAAYAKNVSISSAIISLPLSMVIAFLFSIFAPEILEKHTLKVYALRFVSAAIMITAALYL